MRILPDGAAEVVSAVIRLRRSIKPADFSDRPVDQATVRQLLEAAHLAPTHGMTEPWRFTVFMGSARLELAEFLARVLQQITPQAETLVGKAEKLKRAIQAAPCCLAIGMHRQRSGKIPEVEEISAVACAVQNLHLLATALGMAGYWSSGLAICSTAFRDYLGLQDEDRVLGLFYLGYPAAEWPSGTRSSLDGRIVWRCGAESGSCSERL